MNALQELKSQGNKGRLSLFTRPWGLGGADVVLAVLVVSVVAMMIVPLPTWLLDILLATNLSMSVAVLLVVLYVPDALAVATFPTVLLLTTLFRLSLNVSSTRLILLQADAGQVIRAFGTFVVRGNYVVGAVVFLILTLIQFIVIAKGSERVAEVGARFVLDALPGKQMAIDAELRSGAIDGGEASVRRRALMRESQFYGAMDGAMKFVKGDVVAALVILVINLVGGLLIGVLQRGMPVVEALKRYGLLTIGEGLVSQIPALVLSTAAGVLVTRTASEEQGTPLGRELARHLLGVPRALFVASFFVLGLSLVPGLPTIPFLVLAVLLFVSARARQRHLDREEEHRAATRLPFETSEAPRRFVPLVVPWSVEVSAELEPLLDGVGGAMIPSIRAAVAEVRERIFAELGLPLPAPVVKVNASLRGRQFMVSLHEVPTGLSTLPADVTAEKTAAFVAEATATAIRLRASDFLGLAETQALLDELERLSPATVRNVVPKPVSLALLTDVLRRLLEERTPIRDLKSILEGLAIAAPGEKDPLGLAETIRAHMKRAITFRITRGASQVGVVLLDPTIEDTVRRAITRTASGAFLTLPPAAARDLVTAIRRALDEAAPKGGSVILTQPDIRRFVRKLIETDLPHAGVVSYAELLPEVTLRPLARANLVGIG